MMLSIRDASKETGLAYTFILSLCKQEKIKNLILNSIDYGIDNKFKKIMSMVLIIN